jgi:hypothetical protein
LERFRYRNHTGWKEVHNPSSREARYVYTVSTVQKIIENL